MMRNEKIYIIENNFLIFFRYIYIEENKKKSIEMKARIDSYYRISIKILIFSLNPKISI